MGFYGEFIALFSTVFATMRICLVIEYDGTHFHGWQSQPSKNTVQDYLNSALAKIANHAVSSVAAGRTDAGVVVAPTARRPDGDRLDAGRLQQHDGPDVRRGAPLDSGR